MKIRITNFKLNIAVLWMLAMLFLPTSLSDTLIMTSWTTRYYVITLLTIALLLVPIKKHKLVTIGWQLFGIGMLIVCTFLTMLLKDGFRTEYGYVMLYLCIAFVFSLNLGKYDLPRFYDKLFIVVCVIFIVAGFLVIFDYQPVKLFLNSYYTQHREYGTYVATQRGKPVGTFVQHSISAIMYYLMIVLLYFRNMKKQSIVNFALIGCFIFMIINLKSFTALAVLGLGVILLLINKRKSNAFRGFLLKTLLLIGMVGVVLANTNYITEITSSDVNGLAGRFTGTSLFLQNFDFLRNNILPIGLTNSSTLWLSDCGYIVNLIRGGIVFVFIIYGGFILFVWKNSLNRKAAIALLAAVLLFEVGYPILFEFRFIVFLPFFILYSNQIYQGFTPELQAENTTVMGRKRSNENVGRDSSI